ncbi:MAG: lipid-A-disaccharide synthase N-terminal domain-containing protein, partial [Chthoniobacterales bacterium]
MNSLQFLAETKVFGILRHPWKIVGLTGSLVFGLRFLIQWIASERARKS